MGGSSFGVGDGDGKGGVGPRTTHLTPQKVDCCIDSGDFFHYRVGNIHTGVIHIKKGPIIHQMLLGRIIMLLMVMVEVRLVTGPPTSTPPKKNFGRDRHDRVFQAYHSDLTKYSMPLFIIR